MEQPRSSGGDGKAQLATEEAALRQFILHCDHSHEVLTSIVAQVTPRLADYCASHFGLPEEDANDIARQSIDIALKKRATYDPARGMVRTWLYGIAKMRVLDFLRDRRFLVPLVEEWNGDEYDYLNREFAPVLAEEIPQPNTAPEPDEEVLSPLASLIRKLIFDLPGNQRLAAISTFIDGLAPRHIDERYEWNKGSASVHLSHARKKLKDWVVAELGYMPEPSDLRRRQPAPAAPSSPAPTPSL